MTTPTFPRAPRYAGLDGLRALAVLLVVGYHLFPGWVLQSGFIGVDVFFVISGFLITSLLLRETDAAGRIGLADFWRRRARRLLPALAVVVTVCAAAAWLVGGDVLVGLGTQVIGAATFSYNWVSVAAGGDYFSATAPELFRNLWSLAVEEQFYLLWPLVLPLFLLVRARWVRVAIALALGAASAVWATQLAAGGGDLTRVYFGTDSHAFGLLLGVALAFAARGVLDRPAMPTVPTPVLVGGWKVVERAGSPTAPWIYRRSTRLTTGIVGITAVAALVLLATMIPADGPETFPGALVAASGLTAVAIVCGIWPGSWFGRALDILPLRWIGARSYGIYLWHWPIVVLLAAQVTGQSPEASLPVWVGALALVLTLIAATASYRWIEMPVRRHGFVTSLRMLRAELVAGPRARLGALGVLTVATLALSGTTAAIAAAPRETSSETLISAGQDAIDAAQDAAAAAAATASGASGPTGDGSDGGAVAGAGDGAGASGAPAGADGAAAGEIAAGGTGAESSGANGGTGSTAGSQHPAPTPTPIGGTEITAIGDSVMLASAPALLARFPGIHIDAAVSRSMWAGPDIVQALADAGQLRPYVIVALGTNGPVDRDALDQIARIVGAERHLVVVNASAPRDWIPGVNADLAAFAAGHRGVVVADWCGAIEGRTDLLAGDHVHPGSAGGEVYAETLGAALDAVELARVERLEQADLIDAAVTAGILAR